MKSISLFTEEMDDLEVGVQELQQQIQSFDLGKNTVGIAFAHADTDLEELGRRLKRAFDFPVIGCTAMSMFAEHEGYATDGISLQVFTADDCSFATGLTDEINLDNFDQTISDTYSAMREEMDEDPKLIIAFATKTQEMPGDRFVNVLNKLGNEAPVFGGFGSDNFVFEDCRVFANDEVRRVGVAMVAITGRIKPVFKCQFSVETIAEFDGVATKTDGSTVYTIGDKTFIDAVSATGINSQGDDAFVDFVGTPFLITYENAEGKEIQVMRHLEAIDFEVGSGTFLGCVPEGARVQIAMFSKKDIAKSVGQAIQSAIIDISNEKDFKYTTALIVSCASRLMSFSNDIAVETAGYTNVVPPGIEFSGFYSFGEICPVTAKGDDRFINCFHNSTFTFVVM